MSEEKAGYKIMEVAVLAQGIGALPGLDLQLAELMRRESERMICAAFGVPAERIGHLPGAESYSWSLWERQKRIARLQQVGTGKRQKRNRNA